MKAAIYKLNIHTSLRIIIVTIVLAFGLYNISFGRALKDFKVSVTDKNEVEVSAKLTTTIETSELLLERSSDLFLFTEVNYIKFQNSSINSVDSNPQQGINYYRIRMTNNDGKITYSEIISVHVDVPFSPSFDISPNPARTQNIYLKFEDTRKIAEREIMVFNSAGKLMLSKSLRNLSSEGCDLDVSILKPGSYIVKLYVSREQREEKHLVIE
jgi:hypothetical protein